MQTGATSESQETEYEAREILPRGECIRLLGEAGVGRVGLSIRSLPVILPVNYVVDGARIVFRTGVGAKLDSAVRNAVVCVEVDHIEPRWQSGWSVLVTGQAHHVSEEDVSPEARGILVPWALSAGDHYVAVPLDLVTGRRVGPVLLSS